MSSIRFAKIKDVPQLTDLLVKIFSQGPFHNWLFPESGPSQYKRRYYYKISFGKIH